VNTRVELQTSRGRVAGLSDGAVAVFRGIPFAEAPRGALRFAPPIPRARWSGVFDATKRAPAAPHAASAVGEIIGLTDDCQDEDCLHATVWRPLNATSSSRLPVMVWIHGGGFEAGSAGNPLADGSVLARRGDLVIVSLQYRIGLIGFLPLDGASPNRGVLDLILGLEWVQREIESFGGDPENVTLFGSSAGGVSIAALLALPEACAAIKRAIIQSGSAECFHTAETADATRLEVAKEMRAEGSALRLALEKLDVHALVEIQHRVSLRREAVTGQLTFAPWLPAAPFTSSVLSSLARGSARGIPLLLGSNADEMKLAGLASFPLAPRPLRRWEFRERVTTLLGNDIELADRAMALYEARLSGARRSTNDVYDAIATDLHFRIPTVRVADAHVRHEPRTYRYVLSWPSPQFGPMFGTPHAMEIPLVFATYRKPPMPFFLGTRPSLAQMSDKIQDVWIAFARTGNPSTAATGPWPAYTRRERVRMTLGDTCSPEIDLAPEELAFWHDAFSRLRPVAGDEPSRSASSAPRVSTLFPAPLDH
jgi:para-nitrobenzyl esterase